MQGESYMGTVHRIRSTAKCPHCPALLPIWSDKLQSEYLEHVRNCKLDFKLLANGGIKGNQHRGPLMTRAYKKILGFNHANVVNTNRKKFAEEWNRIDDFWKEGMIVCPGCFSFKIPADEKVRPCPDCKCMMEWAKELVEVDPRFNFAKEFCADD